MGERTLLAICSVSIAGCWLTFTRFMMAASIADRARCPSGSLCGRDLWPGRSSGSWKASAAELYERYLVPAITALWAADLVDRAAPQSGERVLDVACGTGVVARSAAERMGSGQVVGLDINTGMLAVARSLPRGAGPRIDWHEGSALEMPFPNSTFVV